MMSSGLISGPGRHWPCSSQISTVLLRQFSPPPITCGTFSGWVHDCVSTALTNLKPPTHGPPPKKPTQGRHPELTAHSGSRSIFTSPSSQKVSHVTPNSPNFQSQKKTVENVETHPNKTTLFFKAKQRGCCMLGSGTKPSPLRKSQYSASLQQKTIGWLMKEREKKCQERKKQFRVYFFCWSFPPKKTKHTYDSYNIHIPWDLEIQLLYFVAIRKKSLPATVPSRHPPRWRLAWALLWCCYAHPWQGAGRLPWYSPWCYHQPMRKSKDRIRVTMRIETWDIPWVFFFVQVYTYLHLFLQTSNSHPLCMFFL